MTGSASFREWMRAVEGGWMTHATFVGLLDRHRPEFEREGGDGIVAALRSLDFKKDASHASVLTEAGYYEMVGTAKGVTMKTKFPARLKVEVKPWVGVEERVGLEFAVGFDPESVQWKLTAVTDVEEALVQGRTRLRETLQKALPGAVCFDGAPGWAEIP